MFARYRRPLIAVAALLVVGLLLLLWKARQSLQALERHSEALGFREAQWSFRGVEIASLRRNEASLGMQIYAEGISAQWWPAPIVARIDSLSVERIEESTLPTEAKAEAKPEPKPDPDPSAPKKQNKNANTQSAADASYLSQVAPWLQSKLQQRNWSLDIQKGPVLKLGRSRFVALESLHLRSTPSALPPHENKDNSAYLQARKGKQEALPWLTLEAQVALHLRNQSPEATEHWTLRCERSGPFALRQFFLPWTCHIPDLHPDALLVHLSTDGQAWSISAADPTVNGVSARISVDSKARRASLKTQALPFSWIQTAMNLWGKSLPSTLSVDERATMNGGISIAWNRAEKITDLHFEQFSLAPIAIVQHRLAAQPFEIPSYGLSGRIQSDDEAGIALHTPSLHAELEGRIGKLHGRTRIRGNLDRFDLSLLADPQPCQDWLYALPDSWRIALRGTALRGQVGASLDLSLDRQKLQAYAQSDEGIDAAKQLGLLNLHFPFRQECEVTVEPERFSIQALRGENYFEFPPESTRKGPRRFSRSAARYIPLRRIMTQARAFVTAEDPDFWDHDGFAYESMRIAFWHNLAHKKILRGASTISQQCARMLWLGPHRTIARKVQEAFLTWRLEERLKKNHILELYTNLIHLGPEVYGVRNASRFYFRKSIYQLNLRQQVFLSLLPPSPQGYSERFAAGEIDREWSKRIDRHLRRMHEKEWITEKELEEATLAETEDSWETTMQLELLRRSK